MPTETSRIADQLRRAFEGEAWHGPAVLEILDGVSAVQATARPVANAHSIWELTLHIAVWDEVARRRLAGEVVQPTPEQDYPPIKDTDARAWEDTQAHLRRTHDALVQAVAAMPDARLAEKVPGKDPDDYTLYYMLHGIVQHELYHGGQIALLKKALL